MKKRMKQLAVLFLTGAMTMSLFACGKTDESNAAQKDEAEQEETQEKTEEEQEESEAELEGGVLRVMTCGDSTPYFEAIAEQLQEEGFPYEFQIESISDTTELDEKVFLAHASGQDYDIIQVNNSSVQMYVDANVLEPLNDFVAESELNIVENYSESLMTVGAIDGTQYAIPIGPDCRVLAYNKKLLEAGGFDAPETMGEIMEIAQALCGDGVYAYAREMSSPLVPAYVEGCFFAANDAHICQDQDGELVPTCGTEEMIACVEWWQEMMQYMPADTNLSGDQVRQMFVQDQLLFYVFGPWDFPLLADDMEYGVDYELIITPGIESGETGSIMGGWYVGIGSGSQNKEAATVYMEELLRTENISMSTFGLPADNRCYDLEPYNLDKYNTFKEAFQIAEVPYPVTSQFNQIGEIFYEYFNKALIGGEDAAAMMNECDEKIQELLDKE